MIGVNQAFTSRSLCDYNITTTYINEDFDSLPLVDIFDGSLLCSDFNLERLFNEELGSDGDNTRSSSKSLFDDDDDEEDIDPEAWTYKREEEWTKEDTKFWLLWAAEELKCNYGSLSRYFVKTGRELLNLSITEFIANNPLFGEKLYKLLHEDPDSTETLPLFDTVRSISEETNERDNTLPDSGINSSEEENVIALPSDKKRPGRPRDMNKQKKTAGPKLWEFLRDLLNDSRYCPEFIRWENFDKKIFRFVQSQKVAQLWGVHKGNKNMTYEKLSRAMRYHYRKGILDKVDGNRLVYEFGENASRLT